MTRAALSETLRAALAARAAVVEESAAAAQSAREKASERAAVRLAYIFNPDARAHLESELERRHVESSRRKHGRKSGFKRGQPQCSSCRRILNAYGASCPGCGGFAWDR